MSLYVKYRPALKQAFHIELMFCEHRSIVSLSTKVCNVSSINSFQSLHASYKITGSSAHRGSLVQKKKKIMLIPLKRCTITITFRLIV